jgi:cytochrome P450
MMRVALQDFYFSNGVKVPKGETVAAIGNPLHRDPDVYPDALEFKPFRFYELGEADRSVHMSHKYDMITPSADYLAWGLGKHAWYVFFSE